MSLKLCLKFNFLYYGDFSASLIFKNLALGLNRACLISLEISVLALIDRSLINHNECTDSKIISDDATNPGGFPSKWSALTKTTCNAALAVGHIVLSNHRSAQAKILDRGQKDDKIKGVIKILWEGWKAPNTRKIEGGLKNYSTCFTYCTFWISRYSFLTLGNFTMYYKQ